MAATDERRSTGYDELDSSDAKKSLMPMPQAQADKLIAKVAQPLPRIQNGQWLSQGLKRRVDLYLFSSCA